MNPAMPPPPPWASPGAAPAGNQVTGSRLLRYARDRPRAIDVAVVLTLAALSFPGSKVSIGGVPVPSQWPGWLLTGGACVMLMGHRSHPRVTAAVVITCATAVAALGYVVTPLLLAPAMFALYSLAVRASQKTTFTATLAAITVLVCTEAAVGPAGEPGYLKTVSLAEWLVLPVPVAIAARLRLAYLEAVNARAEYAERTREEEARHRVAAERMRIARELHDVVAHHLALASAQASAAAHLMQADQEKARELVTSLVGTTSSALRELKTTVGLLRQANDQEDPTEPAPGLARLEDLAASFRAAGVRVTVSTEGEPRPLPAGVDLTAFRVIQEALTNVAKHAPDSEARVRLGYGADRLGIWVGNETGRAAPAGPSRPGYGLIGMRERVLSAGGRLRAGHRPAGGFAVAVELPLHSGGPDEGLIP